jgi:alpha-1,3-rhamnosyl/mannosyltransferase
MVVNAFSRLPALLRKNFPLVLVGMKGLQANSLTKQILKMVQNHEVIIPGYVAQDDLPKIYSGGRLFVYPSIYEGFGLPPLEAMACGIPVLTSNSSSLPEVTGDAGILIDPQDVEGWSKWINALLEDNNMGEKYRQLGIQRAQLFSWERCAQQTLSAYERALDS